MVEEIAWMEDLSPFDWYDPTTVLREGLMVGDALLSLGVAVLLFVISVLAFNRRDIGV